MKNEITISGVTMSLAAARNVEECAVDVRADLARLRAGQMTADEFLSECMAGADSDRVQGWSDYVNAVLSCV